jgi:hypothetical protein
MDMSKDTLFRGEFEVVKDLLAAFPDGDASKRMCDKVFTLGLYWFLTKNIDKIKTNDLFKRFPSKNDNPIL